MTTPRGRLDTMSHGELAVALRWWCDGDPPTEAAVELNRPGFGGELSS